MATGQDKKRGIGGNALEDQIFGHIPLGDDADVRLVGANQLNAVFYGARQQAQACQWEFP